MCAQDVHSVSTKYSEQECAHAGHLSLPVNKEILSYEDTQNRGVTGNLHAQDGPTVNVLSCL
jgi:hypothetical protein